MGNYRWKIAGTYVQGSSHFLKKIPCQDRFAFLQANGVSSISLADGAGSVKYAEKGAEITTKQVNITMARDFDVLWAMEADKARQKIIHAIRTNIGIQAKKNEAALKDYASTLLFVSVKNDKFIAGHIGDGVLGFHKNNILHVLSLPENGEFVNETYFVTSKSYKQRFRLFKGDLKDIDGFVLMSDGTCESLFDKKNGIIAPIVKTLLDWLYIYSVEEVNAALFENFENIICKKTIDDCSIGVMKLII